LKYLEALNLKETNELLVSLRRFAELNDVPIIKEDGIRFIKQLITIANAKDILEIGTAIAYSAIEFAFLDDAINIITIERDPNMIHEAKKNIVKSHKSDQITLLQGDALEIDLRDDSRFDVIFIDAAKAQSIKFFEKYENYLKPGGIIITDNLLFHGLVENPDEVSSRNLKQLIRKIDTFNHYLMKRTDYDTAIYPIGDGISVSIKRK